MCISVRSDLPHLNALTFLLLCILMHSALADRGRIRIDKTLMTPVTDRGTFLIGGQWAPNRNWFAVPTDATFNRMKAYGHNTVHCYVDYDNGGRAWNNSGVVSDMQTLVDLAGKNGFYVCITAAGSINRDLDGYQIKNDTYYTYLQGFWKLYAPKFGSKTHVFFEIMNEPVHWGYPYSDLVIQRHQELYALIRSYAPQSHICLWSSANLGSASSALATLRKATKINYENASVSFHWYSTSRSAVQGCKDAGFPMICTETARVCDRGESQAKSAALGCMASKVSVLWFDSFDIREGSCGVGPKYQNYFNAWGITWCPDYGTWPQNSATCSTGSTVAQNSLPNPPRLPRAHSTLVLPVRNYRSEILYGINGREVQSGYINKNMNRSRLGGFVGKEEVKKPR